MGDSDSSDRDTVLVTVRVTGRVRVTDNVRVTFRFRDTKPAIISLALIDATEPEMPKITVLNFDCLRD